MTSECWAADILSTWPELQGEVDLARRIRSTADEARLAASGALRKRGHECGVAGASNDIDPEYLRLCFCFLLFGSDTFDSVAILLAHKLLTQGRVMLRTFFESVTNLLYIQQEPTITARRFIGYIHAEVKRFSDKVTPFVAEIGMPADPRKRQSVESRYKMVKHFHANRKGKPRFKWHDLSSFEKLCENVNEFQPGWKSLYGILYIPESYLAHGSAYAVLRRGRPVPSEAQVSPALESPMARNMLLRASDFLFRVVRIVNAGFRLGLEEMLSAWYREYERVAALERKVG